MRVPLNPHPLHSTPRFSPHRAVRVATLAAVLFLASAPAHAKGIFEPISRGASDIGRGIGDAATAAGKGISRGVSAVGKGLSRGGRAVAKTVRDTRTGFKRNYAGRQPKHPYHITLGRAFVSGKGIARGTGSLATYTLDYDAVQNHLLFGNTVVSVFLDGDSGSRYSTNASAEFDASQLGFGVAARRILTGSLDRSHFYFGGGVGFYRTHYVVDPVGPAYHKTTDYSPALRLLAGYQFGSQFYGEFDLYTFNRFKITNEQGFLFRTDPSNARFGIGYRF